MKRGYISFGLGGHSEQSPDKPNSTLFGYDTPEYWTQDKRHLQHLGAIAVDKRDLLKRQPGYAYLAPMADVSLDVIERLPDTSNSLMCKAMKGEPGNAYGSLLKLAERAKATNPEAPGPLDRVPVVDAAIWWGERGAKLGIVASTGITWFATVDSFKAALTD